jgi:hypothetical protein
MEIIFLFPHVIIGCGRSARRLQILWTIGEVPAATGLILSL